ncbi:MAG: Mth938-like domain-containing protein [Ahrensia sp.]|nr:Mth938-like domain-containing protein [Ahrensia sp.]
MRAGIEIREAHFPGRAQIDAYGNGGFRFADMSHRGSVLLLPSGIFGWNVSSMADVSAHNIAQIISEATDIDVLLFGCGTDLMRVPEAIRQVLRDHKITCDSMSTGAAVRTYNVLLAEERKVAAALIAVDNA